VGKVAAGAAKVGAKAVKVENVLMSFPSFYVCLCLFFALCLVRFGFRSWFLV
jgi:hypothetical protein